MIFTAMVLQTTHGHRVRILPVHHASAVLVPFTTIKVTWPWAMNGTLPIIARTIFGDTIPPSINGATFRPGPPMAGATPWDFALVTNFISAPGATTATLSKTISGASTPQTGAGHKKPIAATIPARRPPALP